MRLRMVLPCLVLVFSIATLVSGFYLLASACAFVAAFLLLVALLIPDAL